MSIQDESYVLEQIEKETLNLLYDNKGDRPMSTHMIGADIANLFGSIYRTSELEYALRNLKSLKLVRSKRNAAIKAKSPGQWSMPAHDVYEIDLLGNQCVESDYLLPKKQPHNSNGQVIFNNGQIIIGNPTINEYNVFNLINELNIDASEKNEIMNVFNTIQQEVNKETIQKSKLKELLKLIADKGSSKLLEAALGAVIKGVFP